MEVRREILLPSDPEEVWEALTEAERLEKWFATEVELDAVPGSSGIFRWGDGDVRRVLVEEVEPARRFAFSWDESRVVELEPADGCTLVVVTETREAGWGIALALRALAYAHA